MLPTPLETRDEGVAVVVFWVTGSYAEMIPPTHVITGFVFLQVSSQTSATVGRFLQSQVPVEGFTLPPLDPQNERQ
jgi:hypothetical protein